VERLSVTDAANNVTTYACDTENNQVINTGVQVAPTSPGQCSYGYILEVVPDALGVLYEVCYQAVPPPCPPGWAATPIGGYCYAIYLPQTIYTDSLPVNAKVIFFGTCKVEDVIINWLEMTAAGAPAGGRALVVPDIAAMATLSVNANIKPEKQGLVDLVQAVEAYKVFVRSLSEKKTVQQAVNDVNSTLNTFYPTIDYSSDLVGPNPQAVFKVVGNANWCTKCK